MRERRLIEYCVYRCDDGGVYAGVADFRNEQQHHRQRGVENGSVHERLDQLVTLRRAQTFLGWGARMVERVHGIAPRP